MATENPNQPLEESGNATVEDGLVLLEGPDGVAITLTAQAARKTGESLIAAADEAEQASPRTRG